MTSSHEASSLSPEEQLAARRCGSVVGGIWRLERVLGVGGMAAVYAARAEDGRIAAVKLLHESIAMHPDVRQRFLREGMAANRVAHPGAVQIIDHATAEGAGDAYLVMELLEGESFGDRLRRSTPSVDELLGVLEQTLDVLAAAHERGIVHRDLKPDNLFVTSQGAVKVLDFGVARFLDAVPGDVRTKTGIAMGTLPFMAPEQALGRRDQIDGRTDLFALGAMAFRISSGRRVHEADGDAALLLAMATQPAPPLLSVAADVPAPVAAIVDLALAFDRLARYPDARTMQNDVRAVRAGAPPPYASNTSRSREQATRAEMRAPVVAAVAPASPQAARTPTVVAPAGKDALALATPPARTPTVVASPAQPKPDQLAVVAPLPLAPQRTTNRRNLLLGVAVMGALAALALLIGLSSNKDAESEVEQVEPATPSVIGGEAKNQRPSSQWNTDEAREQQKRVEEQRREARKRAEELQREQRKHAEERVREREKKGRH